MADDVSRVVLEVDDTPAVQGTARANAAMEQYEKRATGAVTNINRDVERQGETLVRVTDRSRSSVNALLNTLEKQAALYGKTGIEKLAALRDLAIQKLNGEQSAIERVTKAYDRMIAEETKTAALERRNQLLEAAQAASRRAAAGAEQFQRALAGVNQAAAQAAQRQEQQIAALERQAALAGKSGAQRMTIEQKQFLEQLGKTNPAQAERVAAAYRKMQDALYPERSGYERFAAGVKNFIQSPLQAAGDAVEGFLTKLGPMGSLVTGVFTGIAAAAVLAFNCAKDLAQLGDQAEDTAARMGLSIRDEEAFRFAMKRAGGDIGQLEGIMRKLSQEIEGGGKNLRQMGVEFRDVQTGQLRPMSETILQLAHRLAELPEGPIRNAAALRVMGRAALEVLPDLMELEAGVQRFNELGLGLSDEQVKRFGLYQKHIAEIEARFEQLKTAAKESLVITVEFVTKVTGQLAWLLGLPAAMALSKRPTATDQEMGETKGWGYGAAMSREGHRADLRARALNSRLIDSLLGSTPEERLEIAKQKLADLRSEVEKLHDVYSSQSESAREKYAAQKSVVTGIETEIKAAKDLQALRKEIDAYQRQGDEAELSAAEKIFYHRDQLLAQAQKVKASAADIAKINSGANKQFAAELAKANETFNKYVAEESHKRSGIPATLWTPAKDQFREWEWGFRADEEIPKIQAAAERSILRAEATKAMRMAELAAPAGREVEAINQAYNLRLALAHQIREEQMAAISDEATAGERRIAEAKAEAEVRKEIHAAQLEAELKLAELQRRRIDELKSSIEGLLDAAFARSRSVLDALKGMAQAVFLTPVKHGVSTLMAQALMPIMYGKDGRGGLMGAVLGIFGQRNQGIQDVKLVSGAVPVVITNGPLASTGGTVGLGALVGSVLASGRVVGGEVIGAGSSATAGLTQAASGLWQRGGIPAVVGGPGGTSGFAGPVQTLGLNGIGSRGGLISGLLRGGVTAASLAPLALAGSGLGLMGAFSAGQSGNGVLKGLAPAIGAFSGMLGMGALTAMFPALVALGPWGFAAAGAIGALAGLIGIFRKPATEKAREKIKTLYGIDIQDKGVLQQIVEMAKQSYGNNLDMAIRSQQIRDLIQLYAMSTGQSTKAMPATVHSLDIVQSGGSLYQSPGYSNGTLMPFFGGLPPLDNIGSGVASNAASGVTVVSFQVDSKEVGRAIVQDGRVVSQGMIKATKSSAGRRELTSLQMSPGLLTS